MPADQKQSHLCLDQHQIEGKKQIDVHICVLSKRHRCKHSDGRKIW